MPLRDDQLTPTQRTALDTARALLTKGPLVSVATRDGCGRSTILELLAGELGAPVIRLADIVAACSEGHPLQLEEGFMRVVLGALADNEAVVVDDLHAFIELFARCYGAARPSIMPMVFDAVRRTVESSERKLVIGIDHHPPPGLADICLQAVMPRFDAGDLVELWLQMKLPDEAARAAIAADRLAACPEPLRDVAPADIAAATEGLTGADIKRVIADAVNLYGYDVAAGETGAEPFHYVEQALDRLRRLREELAAAPPVTSAHYGAATRAAGYPRVVYAQPIDG